MSTSTEAATTDLTEFESAVNCDVDDCDADAVALYTKSHTAEGCWGPVVHMCQIHLVQSLRNYENWLGLFGVCCQCYQPIRGGLAQNTRIVRL